MTEVLERRGGFTAEGNRELGSTEDGLEMHSSEGDSCFNYHHGKKYSGSRDDIRYDDRLPKKRPQFPGSTVCWERFLPLRSLKVLLVENDDSTRHVVRALLQNCSYEVTAVSNGVQAWIILEDLTNHFDIVLTEVVTPLLTGVGLLSKIMNHKTLKNIPVIMMSSHDSMGVVFKCLSKGAVDFLVKPIRKNELKNLWQHVWRKCHSSCGSGSESGTQIKSPEGTESPDDLENNTGSNDEHENGSTELGIRPTSDNGSGTQNSWTRKLTETNSPDSESPGNKFSDALDINYSRVLHTEAGIMNRSGDGVHDAKKYRQRDSKYFDLSMGKDLEIPASLKSENPHQHRREEMSLQRRINGHELPDLQSKLYYRLCKEDVDEKPNIRSQDDTLIGSFPEGNCTETAVPNTTSEIYGTSLNTETKNTSYKEMLSVDLNLQGQRGVADVGASTSDDQNVLRHSNLSAFSKYRNEPSSSNQAINGKLSSCFLTNNSPTIGLMSETIPNFLPHSESTPRFYSEGHGKLAALCASQNSNDKSPPLSSLLYFDQNFQTGQNSDIPQSEHPFIGKLDDRRVNTIQSDPTSSHLHGQVQHHHSHHYHHVRNLQSLHGGNCQDLEDPPFKHNKSGALQSGSSHLLSGPLESGATNYSMNGSASGSNHGSNDHGSRGKIFGNIALNTELPNLEIDDMIMQNRGCERHDENGGNDRSFRHKESMLTMFLQNEECTNKMEKNEGKSDSYTKNMEVNTRQSETSNVIGMPFEINVGKCSMNRSNSKTSHDGNQQTMSCTLLNLGIQHSENENIISRNSGGCLHEKYNGNGGEDDRSAQREAALSKFRQKRKERCFEKKVRYQSRKMLADQRPRIRGQFVRQIRREEYVEECSSSVFGEGTYRLGHG